MVITAQNLIVAEPLEGQLLGLTLQKERPELEEQMSTLLRQEDECKVGEGGAGREGGGPSQCKTTWC